MGRYSDYWFPPAAPRPPPVEGKAGKKFGKSWWGRAWIEKMEDKATDSRASRGRAYARADRVYDIKIGPGAMSGKVEGSSGEEYQVKLTRSLLKADAKSALLKRLCAPAIAGQLLNNELPQEFACECSDVLLKGIQMDCSCPDYENPCKHIAALFYVLADEIDMAPQILFNLCGISNGEMLSAIKGATPVVKGTRPSAHEVAAGEVRGRKRGRPSKSEAKTSRSRKVGRPPREESTKSLGRSRRKGQR